MKFFLPRNCYDEVNDIPSLPEIGVLMDNETHGQDLQAGFYDKYHRQNFINLVENFIPIFCRIAVLIIIKREANTV